nr:MULTISPECIES: carotenoid oxygenase family protein [unclassified Haloarcula]
MSSHPGFHSLYDETAASISVTGTLPDWLRGSLIRNGPGDMSGASTPTSRRICTVSRSRHGTSC